jgi:hypothetical protein
VAVGISEPGDEPAGHVSRLAAVIVTPLLGPLACYIKR